MYNTTADWIKEYIGAWIQLPIISVSGPEKDATLMLCLSTAVCWPGFCFTVTRGKPLQLSGPWSDKAWLSASKEPTRVNSPSELSCSQLRISQCKEHRLMLLRSSSSRNVRSSLRPVDLIIKKIATFKNQDINNCLWTWRSSKQADS